MVEIFIDGLLSANPSSIYTLTNGRVYPLVLPKDPVFPAIHYSFVGGNSTSTFDTFGTQKQRLEVNCWGGSYSDAVTLRKAVVATLSQYNQAGVFITFLSSTDFFDHEALSYRAMAEFYVFSQFSPQ